MKLRFALVLTALLTLALGPMARASAPSPEAQWSSLVAEFKLHPTDAALKIRVSRFLKSNHASRQVIPMHRLDIKAPISSGKWGSPRAGGLCYPYIGATRSGFFGVYYGYITFLWNCEEASLDACAITGINLGTAMPLTHVGGGLGVGNVCGGNSTGFLMYGGWPRFIGVMTANSGSIEWTTTYDF